MGAGVVGRGELLAKSLIELSMQASGLEDLMHVVTTQKYITEYNIVHREG